VIAEGRCRAFKIVDGGRAVLREMGPGEVFGETAVFSERPRTASVEAVDDVVVMVLTRRQFEQDLGLGFWIGRFVRALAERFVERDARVTELERRHARRSCAD
jgi:serine/threonine-protein kinase